MQGGYEVGAKNKLVVRIAGKEYTIVASEPDEYIQRVSLYVDKKMNEIMRSNNKLSTSMAAVLTALNVADDFFKAGSICEKLQKQLQEIEEKYDKLKAEYNQIKQDCKDYEQLIRELELDLAAKEAELKEVRERRMGA